MSILVQSLWETCLEILKTLGQGEKSSGACGTEICQDPF